MRFCHSQSRNIAITNQLPGKLFQAVVLPSVAIGKESKVPAKFELRSTCGCPVDDATLRQTEATGKPANVALTQVRKVYSNFVLLSKSCFGTAPRQDLSELEGHITVRVWFRVRPRRIKFHPHLQL